MKVVLIGPMNFRAIMSCQQDWVSIGKERTGPEPSSKAILQLPTAAEALAPLGDTCVLWSFLDCNGVSLVSWKKPNLLNEATWKNTTWKLKSPTAARKNLERLCGVLPRLAKQGEQLLLCWHHRVLPCSRLLSGSSCHEGQNTQIPKTEKK